MDEGCAHIELKGARYELYRLMFENKGRMRGYTAFYRPIDPAQPESTVQIVDAADLC
jgi:hypothetical protein